MDMREAKALEIAARSRVTFDGKAWIVPSQTGSGTYRVTLASQPSCECDDFALRQLPCKHIIAARLVRERDGEIMAPAIDTDVLPTKPTYKQAWSAYNTAQATENRRLQILLHDLCCNLPERERLESRRGPKPHLVRDAIFAMAFKVYCGLSSRRFSTDLLDAHEKGFVSKPIPGAKVTAFFEDPYFTPILKDLIAISALPLRAVETNFAIDSTGFASTRYERWYDHKYGATRQKCLWVKTHIASSVKTNVVTAVRILDKDAADCPQFVPLVKETRRYFEIGEVSADKAYASLENFEAVAECCGQVFMAFESNTTGGVGGLFEKAFHYFQFNRDEYLDHYHLRSNIESTISAIKRKFGDSVMSKTDAAMVNEVLPRHESWSRRTALLSRPPRLIPWPDGSGEPSYVRYFLAGVILGKLLCHNLTCLIQEQETLGIVPIFWKDEDQEAPAILPLVRAQRI